MGQPRRFLLRLGRFLIPVLNPARRNPSSGGQLEPIPRLSGAGGRVASFLAVRAQAGARAGVGPRTAFPAPSARRARPGFRRASPKTLGFRKTAASWWQAHSTGAGPASRDPSPICSLRHPRVAVAAGDLVDELCPPEIGGLHQTAFLAGFAVLAWLQIPLPFSHEAKAEVCKDQNPPGRTFLLGGGDGRWALGDDKVCSRDLRGLERLLPREQHCWLQSEDSTGLHRGRGNSDGQTAIRAGSWKAISPSRARKGEMPSVQTVRSAQVSGSRRTKLRLGT